ncbi:MAG TPA: hypothetical protein VF812_10500 [Ktedonobacterales bacterium]
MRVMIALRVEVPEERLGELPALIAAEGEHAAEHTRLGILENVYLSTDRTMVWAVMKGDTLDEIQRLTASYPMYSLFRDVTYTALVE